MTQDLLEYSRITSQARETTPVNFEHVLGRSSNKLESSNRRE